MIGGHVKRVLLSSAGFENPEIAKRFLELCGGDPAYLLRRINDTGSDRAI
jgi:hypothetical protein